MTTQRKHNENRIDHLSRLLSTEWFIEDVGSGYSGRYRLSGTELDKFAEKIDGIISEEMYYGIVIPESVWQLYDSFLEKAGQPAPGVIRRVEREDRTSIAFSAEGRGTYYGFVPHNPFNGVDLRKGQENLSERQDIMSEYTQHTGRGKAKGPKVIVDPEILKEGFDVPTEGEIRTYPYNPFNGVDLRKGQENLSERQENTFSFLEDLVIEEELPEDIRTATMTVMEHLKGRIDHLRSNFKKV